MYKFLGIHFSKWLRVFSFFSKFFRLEIYPKAIKPAELKKLFANSSVIYAMPRMSILDIMAVNKSLKKMGLPPIWHHAAPKRFRRAAVLALKPRVFSTNTEKQEQFIHDTAKLFKYDPRVKKETLFCVPVSVFWSRIANNEDKNKFLRLFYPDDGSANFLQKILMFILHRGEVVVTFSKPFHMSFTQFPANTAPSKDGEDWNISDDSKTSLNKEYMLARRFRRMLAIEFNKERAAILGPRLYDRETIYNWILSSPETKKLIEESDNPTKSEASIVKYLQEIAAKYDYTTVRFFEKVFQVVWFKIFSGVKVRNFEIVREKAKGGQVIWMPCHRSHLDYLLLSYVLFTNGFTVPHIAAGANLSFWPVSSILRRGGAFFIRRSFGGNKVYAHVFSQYVHFLLQNSYPVEVFPEGGRSRIGKLITPKIGFLSICISSIIKRKAENTYFCPVFFSYDKVMEENAYARELKGEKKKKENFWQLLQGLKKLFGHYGHVNVSFGEPIKFKDAWDKFQQTSSFKLDKTESIFSLDNNPRQEILPHFTKFLAQRVHQNINSAAVASHSAILASVLLSQSEREFSKNEFLRTCSFVYHFIESLSHTLNWKSGVCENLADQADKIFAEAEKWKFIEVKLEDVLKQDKIYREQSKEFNLWWYRGTVFHLLAPLGLVSYCLALKDLTLQNLCDNLKSFRQIYSEQLYWDSETNTESILTAVLDFLISKKIIFSKAKDNETVYSRNSEEFGAILNGFAGFVRPELDTLYYVLRSAFSLTKEEKTFFYKDEVVKKAELLHEESLSKNLEDFPVFQTKLYAPAQFENLVKSGIFINNELAYKVNPNAFQEHTFISLVLGQH